MRYPSRHWWGTHWGGRGRGCINFVRLSVSSRTAETALMLNALQTFEECLSELFCFLFFFLSLWKYFSGTTVKCWLMERVKNKWSGRKTLECLAHTMAICQTLTVNLWWGRSQTKRLMLVDSRPKSASVLSVRCEYSPRYCLRKVTGDDGESGCSWSW